MTDFGISPEHVRGIADTWEREGRAVAALTFTPGLQPAFGCASLDGLLQCAEAAEKTGELLGDALAALGTAVHRFNAVTQESDAAAAVEITGGRS